MECHRQPSMKEQRNSERIPCRMNKKIRKCVLFRIIVSTICMNTTRNYNTSITTKSQEIQSAKALLSDNSHHVFYCSEKYTIQNKGILWKDSIL